MDPADDMVSLELSLSHLDFEDLVEPMPVFCQAIAIFVLTAKIDEADERKPDEAG